MSLNWDMIDVFLFGSQGRHNAGVITIQNVLRGLGMEIDDDLVSGNRNNPEEIKEVTYNISELKEQMINQIQLTTFTSR